MSTFFHAGICVLFFLLASFWVGKKIGQRRFYKIQEKMEALELSFKTLMDDMEMVSAHNMKVLEARSEEIKELMTIADKKCLYANDLLNELDTTSASLKIRNIKSDDSLVLEQVTERKCFKDIQKNLDDICAKIRELSERINICESLQTNKNNSDIRNMITNEISHQLEEMLLSAPATHTHKEQITALSGSSAIERSFKQLPNITDTVENTIEQGVTDKTPDFDDFHRTLAPSRLVNIKEIRAEATNEAPPSPILPMASDAHFTVTNAKPIGFPATEVLSMYKKGVTLPQIARSCNMSKNEIELIIKIYGDDANIRKTANVP